MLRSDAANRANLANLFQYVWDNVPIEAMGDMKKVSEWLKTPSYPEPELLR